MAKPIQYCKVKKEKKKFDYLKKKKIAAKITGVRGNSELSFSAFVLTNSINQGIWDIGSFF